MFGNFAALSESGIFLTLDFTISFVEGKAEERFRFLSLQDSGEIRSHCDHAWLYRNGQ